MNEIHEAKRNFWNDLARSWEKRTDERGLWNRCHRDPTLVLSPGEMRYLSEVDRKEVCVLGSGHNEVVFALAGSHNMSITGQSATKSRLSWRRVVNC